MLFCFVLFCFGEEDGVIIDIVEINANIQEKV